MTARWPDFFIVGAPRCGTTSMYAALRQHPRIFMPQQKEPAFFCPDLSAGGDFGAVRFIPDEEAYRSLFEPARPGQLGGEACALNLYSEVAAQRIRAANPDARIFVHVRDPVEQMASWHATLVFNNVEAVSNFRAAVGEEPARSRAGNRSPNGDFTPLTLYRAFATFSRQIERYLDAFPREQVHLVVFDDLAADTRAAVRDAYRFLGVDDAFQPTLTVEQPNPGFASRRLFDAMRSPRLIRAAKKIVPGRLHRLAGRAALRGFSMNARFGARARLDSATRDQLRADMASDVARLSELLQRDLAALWWGPSASR